MCVRERERESLCKIVETVIGHFSLLLEPAHMCKCFDMALNIPSTLGDTPLGYFALCMCACEREREERESVCV